MTGVAKAGFEAVELAPGCGVDDDVDVHGDPRGEERRVRDVRLHRRAADEHGIDEPEAL